MCHKRAVLNEGRVPYVGYKRGKGKGREAEYEEKPAGHMSPLGPAWYGAFAAIVHAMPGQGKCRCRFLRILP